MSLIAKAIVAFTLAALSSTLRAQDFLVDWVAGGQDGQISVNLGTGVWDDHSNGDGGTAANEGGDIVLRDDLGRVVAILKGAAGALPGSGGNVESDDPPTSIGSWECVEF